MRETKISSVHATLCFVVITVIGILALLLAKAYIEGVPVKSIDNEASRSVVVKLEKYMYGYVDFGDGIVRKIKINNPDIAYLNGCIERNTIFTLNQIAELKNEIKELKNIIHSQSTIQVIKEKAQ